MTHVITINIQVFFLNERKQLMNAALLGIFFNAVSGKLMIVFPFDYF